MYIMPFPRVIWSYWNEKVIPPVVAKCIESWRKHNPEWSVVILNKENYSTYIDIDIHQRSISSDAHFVDVLRISLVEKYGGFWLDSTIICYDSIEKIFNINEGCDFYGYFMDYHTDERRYPVIENWLFGAPIGSKFVQRWKLELVENVNSFNTNTEYVEKVLEDGVNIKDIPHPEVLTMHVAAQVVLQTIRADFNLYLKSVNEGPFKLYNDAGWDLNKANALILRSPEKYKKSFLKLRTMDIKEQALMKIYF